MGSKERSHEKKTAVLLDFVQIASSPPPPQFGQLVQLFPTPKFKI